MRERYPGLIYPEYQTWIEGYGINWQVEPVQVAGTSCDHRNLEVIVK
jgi:hypothetical protein